MMAAVFGISLGSSTASIAVSKGSKVEVLANHVGERTTPTIVAYRDGEVMIGRSAKQSLHRNTRNTASHMTLLIGKDFDDEDVQKMTSLVMCEVGRGEEGRVCYVMEVEGREKHIPVSDTLTHILKSLYETAGSFSNSSQRCVVAAVPPNYSTIQRKAVRLCCEAAGFEVMIIISEPAAISLAHDIGQRNKTDKSYVLVYTLGAHTLTLTLLLVSGGMYSEMVTRCVWGVGGGECDELIANFLANEFEKQWKVGIHDNKKARFKLLAAAESAKHALSTVQTTSVHLESLHDGLDFTYSLSRGRFEGLCSAVFRRCVNSELLSGLLSEANISKDELNHVILAGGSCKIPLLQKLLETEFPTSELHLLSPPPDEAIATGCALQAALMQRRWERWRESGEEEKEEEDEGVMLPCIPYDLWIKGTDVPEQLLLSSFTPLPCHASLSLPLSPSVGRSCDVCCLELREKSTNQERVIAELHVPVSGGGVDGDKCEGVRGEGVDGDKCVDVTVTLTWTLDHVITITAKHSDWTISHSLSCETE